MSTPKKWMLSNTMHLYTKRNFSYSVLLKKVREIKKLKPQSVYVAVGGTGFAIDSDGIDLFLEREELNTFEKDRLPNWFHSEEAQRTLT